MSGERVQAFVPAPLPPDARTLDLASLQGILAEANHAVGRLDGMVSAFPDLNLLLYSYVRKEAVLSSQIEGTQSSLSDLLLYENAQVPGVPLDDVQEVSNYVAALNHGLKRLRGGFPLSPRLIREIHEVLLAKGRGSHAQPGEFRKSQNWIGGSRPGNAAYVPPPPEYVIECLGDLEAFLHEEETSIPLLIRAGLAHAQFETIHPFLDGNGRVGRLLITFMLTEKQMLHEPVLYLSLFFKQHRHLYYDRLNGTRKDNGWNHWLDFFLQGVRDTADQAVKTAIEIDRLFRADKEKIEDIPDLEKTATLLEGHLGSSLGLRLLRKAEAFQFFSYLFNLEEWAGRDRLREETGVDRQIVKSPVAWHSDHVQVGKRHVQMFSVSPFGQPSEMDRISVTAERHSLPVIDDSAQSFGAVHKGKQLIGMKVLASK